MTDHEHGDVVIPWLADEEARAEHARGLRAGVTHRRALCPRAPRPGEPVVVELTAGPGCSAIDAWVEVEGARLPLELVAAEWDVLVSGYVRRYRGTLPGRPAGVVVSYRLGVGEEEADGGRSQAYAVLEPAPESWAAGAIVYQVFVDRFWAGDGVGWPGAGSGPAELYGGTLRGLLERLDYIAELGVNTIWLNPIHPSGSYHGYDITDHAAVDPRLGTLADFDRLVAELHARGLRIVLDFVASHVSVSHPTFAAARADESSEYADWYSFERWPGSYERFFGVDSMPSLNHAHMPVRQHLIDAALFWLDRGVDGFRLDYALGPSLEFWAELRAAVKSQRPECWLFGEVVETPQTQLEYQGLFDGCLDFALVEALRASFAYGTSTPAELASFLEAQEAFFPHAWSRPAFLDNHDMNRFLWIAGGDSRRLLLAALCLFTLPGPPILYYGSEVGLSQVRGVKDSSAWGGDRHARLPMLWGSDQDERLLAVFRDLARLRTGQRALRDAPTRVLAADASSLRYARGPLVVSLDFATGSGVVSEGDRDLLRLPDVS